MGDIVYLRIIGEKQGDISSGCGTYASVGNRWQVGHEDEIFAFALTNAITSTGKGVNLQVNNIAHFISFQFILNLFALNRKLISRSIINAFNEKLFLLLNVFTHLAILYLNTYVTSPLHY